MSKKALAKILIGTTPASRGGRGTCRPLLGSNCFAFMGVRLPAIIAATLLTLFLAIDSSSGFSARSAPEKNILSPSKGDIIQDASTSQPRHDSLAETGAVLAQNAPGQANPFRGTLPSQEKDRKLPKRAEVKVLVGNLRERPTINSQIIARLRIGDEVTLVHQQAEWFIVRLTDDRLGWAHEILFGAKGSTLEPKKAPWDEKDMQVLSRGGSSEPGPHAVKKLTVEVGIGHIREEPSPAAKAKFRVEKGDTVSVRETRNGWHLVELDDGRTGWAHEQLFLPTPRTQETKRAPFKKIKEIRVRFMPEGEERAIFVLNGFYPPEMYAIEGEKPRVVCDFFGARLMKGISRRMEIDGSLIKRVRIGIHEGARPRVRVVLDLASHENYDVQQIFLKEKYLYTVIVRRLENPDKL